MPTLRADRSSATHVVGLAGRWTRCVRGDPALHFLVMRDDTRVVKGQEDGVEAFEVLNRWRKFDVPGDDTEVHLRRVVIGGDTFVELRDYFPSRDRYGTGYLIGQVPLTPDLEDLVERLSRFHRD